MIPWQCPLDGWWNIGHPGHCTACALDDYDEAQESLRLYLALHTNGQTL